MQRETPHRYTEMYRRGRHQVIMEAKTEAMPTQSQKMIGATRGERGKERCPPRVFGENAVLLAT